MKHAKRLGFQVLRALHAAPLLVTPLQASGAAITCC